MKLHVVFYALLLGFSAGCSKPAAPVSADSSPPAQPAPKPPYAQTVPGKPGFVTSPYAPSAGYIDVRGFSKDAQVKDPYSGKAFLVPDIGPAPASATNSTN